MICLHFSFENPLFDPFENCTVILPKQRAFISLVCIEVKEGLRSSIWINPNKFFQEIDQDTP